MKPHYERLVHSPEEGFALKEIFGADCSCPWHFHAEYELILVLESQGYRIIGDDVTPLRKGDMVFIGSNLPHLYQHKPPRMSSQCEPRSILLQFDERYWKAILDLPAMTPIRRWLPQASLGLKVSGKTRTAVAEMLLRALEARGPRRIAEFIRILDTLSRSRSNQNIASPSFNATLNPFDEERVNRVYQYINEKLLPGHHAGRRGPPGPHERRGVQPFLPLAVRPDVSGVHQPLAGRPGLSVAGRNGHAGHRGRAFVGLYESVELQPPVPAAEEDQAPNVPHASEAPGIVTCKS